MTQEQINAIIVALIAIIGVVPTVIGVVIWTLNRSRKDSQASFERMALAERKSDEAAAEANAQTRLALERELELKRQIAAFDRYREAAEFRDREKEQQVTELTTQVGRTQQQYDGIEQRMNAMRDKFDSAMEEKNHELADANARRETAERSAGDLRHELELRNEQFVGLTQRFEASERHHATEIGKLKAEFEKETVRLNLEIERLNHELEVLRQKEDRHEESRIAADSRPVSVSSAADSIPAGGTGSDASTDQP